MKKISQAKLDIILSNHQIWLDSDGAKGAEDIINSLGPTPLAFYKEYGKMIKASIDNRK